MDLTEAAVPFYFGSMGLEYVASRRRAGRDGPHPTDYEWRDTLASLAMGTGSLILPVYLRRVARKAALPGGRHSRKLLGAAAAAALGSVAVDRLSELPRDSRVRRVARRLRGGTAVAAVSTAGALVTTTWAARTAPEVLYRHRLRRDLGRGPLAHAAAILGWDFIYYWNHRLMHESRFMWAIHVVHHSSRRYNLSTALRQPWADALGTFVPQLMALGGVHPDLIATARGVNLLYQFWIHTDLIGRLGPFESVLNTPSHHRVHHGANQQYIDRNHGSILIVWDRLFGTFEGEREPVVYGLTKNIGTFNPLRIATHEYADIAEDVASSTSWGDRLSYVLRGPGWAYERRARRDAPAEVDDELVEVGAGGGGPRQRGLP